MSVGDGDFDDFVRARYRALHRLAFLLCGDWQHAEDHVQAALARTYDATKHRKINDLDAYARRAVVRGYATSRRRRWNGETPTDEVPERLGADGRHSNAVEDRLACMAALGSLPARQRCVLVLRYYLDLSDQEIAEQMGVSVGTVKSRAARGLQALRGSRLLPTREPSRSHEVENYG